MSFELKRNYDWAVRFHNFIDEVKAKPFEWSNDCVVGLAGGLVRAMTGVDVVADFRGRYDSAFSAYRAMKELGVDNLADAVALYLPRYDHPSQARLADIVAIPVEGDPAGFALGICNGETLYVMGEKGLGILPRAAATQAFRVG